MSANTTAPATAQLTTANKAVADQLRPCACRFVVVDGKRSACQRTTKRDFAPGHDAQLKSRLIAAAVAGSSVGHLVSLAADAAHTASSPAEEAGRFGFGHQVTAGVVRAQRLAQDKAARKAARDLQREANKATREAAREQAAKVREAKREQRSADRAAAAQTRELQAEQKRQASAPKTVQAKVGRWVVTGTVAKNGDLSYTTKKGDAKVAKAGSWSPVA